MSDPNAWWWIKGDGVDVVKGIGESVKGEWSGDVDLNDGKLDDLFQEYKGALESASRIGLGNSAQVHADLTAAFDSVQHYLTFIHDGELFVLD